MANIPFEFSKMHGLGNDFVVIDGVNQSISLSKENIQQIADRRTGIGCDQVLLLEPSKDTEVDFNYRIFNADGTEVGQCGNGARCVSRFIKQKKLSEKQELKLQTNTTVVHTKLLTDQAVMVDMGVPDIESRKQYELTLPQLDGQSISFVKLNLGNPHAVIIVNDFNNEQILEIGAILNQHAFFPEGVNVGFLKVVDEHSVRLRVYERGVGETKACGSGACAGVVAASVLGLVEEQVVVELLGGCLTINWQAGKGVLMTGPANFVFEGVYNPLL